MIPKDSILIPNDSGYIDNIYIYIILIPNDNGCS